VPSPKEMIDGIRAAFGHAVGTRTLHAKGQYFQGTFTPSEQAASMSKAAHLGSDRVPAVARISNGAGDAERPDYADDVRGLAVSFQLPDGSRTDILAQTIPRLAVRSPEAFLEVVQANEAGAMRALKLPWFLIRHPGALGALAELPPAIRPPSSYAAIEYHALHAFKLVAGDGSERWVRFTWRPGAADIPAISRSEARQRGEDYLQEDIRKRLESGPVRFTLTCLIAHGGDDPHDGSDKWSSDEVEQLGTLEITTFLKDGPPGGEPFVFDPMRLTDGIEPSNDPILLYRPAAYSESVERRMAETSAGA
jgi:catalase